MAESIEQVIAENKKLQDENRRLVLKVARQAVHIADMLQKIRPQKDAVIIEIVGGAPKLIISIECKNVETLKRLVDISNWVLRKINI